LASASANPNCGTGRTRASRGLSRNRAVGRLPQPGRLPALEGAFGRGEATAHLIVGFLDGREGDGVSDNRFLVVTADDFGIGAATTQGILELAKAGRVTGSVLLVTSPHAVTAVEAWRRAGEPLELGWHPCLTLDQPVAPARLVRSLIDGRGRFWPLGRFVCRLIAGCIRTVDIETELRAQYERFRELVGHPPSVVNSHHHVQVFSPVGDILGEILASQMPRPYMRRILEPWRALLRVPGARLKRTLLTMLGRSDASRQRQRGFPGNDWLAGITNPGCVTDPNFLVRWLNRIPGRVVELTCHPGRRDLSLVGRDCALEDEQLDRRVYELALLSHPRFQTACAQAGLTLMTPSDIGKLDHARAHAA
jgi:predicted glycoside hydrolase/deacetylase ChbG (UPF0249 family)